jgi:hypothetical protein
MEQLTLQQLYDKIGEALKKHPSWANKKVIAPSDNEGNEYHGMYYGITGEPKVVKQIVDQQTWGIQDSETEDPKKLVIVG